MGIRTVKSHARATSDESPLRSDPRTRAVLCDEPPRSNDPISRSDFGSSPTTRSAASITSVKSATTGGHVKIDPALARTAFGENGSADPGPSTTRPPESASTARMTVPTFPGSAGRSRNTKSPASPIPARPIGHTPITRLPEPSELAHSNTDASTGNETKPSVDSGGVKSSTYRRVKGSAPARRADSSTSSPSPTNVPDSCRYRLLRSRRTSRTSLCRLVAIAGGPEPLLTPRVRIGRTGAKDMVGDRPTVQTIQEEQSPYMDSASSPRHLYLCRSCGFLYDAREGDPTARVGPNTDFGALGQDWMCPLCNGSKSDFVPYHPHKASSSNMG